MTDFIPEIKHIESGSFFLIAGPCVIENESEPLKIASEIKAITDELKIPFIFKASYRKANRSKLDSFTGIGDIEGLTILKRIGTELAIPVITDIHSADEADMAAMYVDILQIPAFLCRQTDLLLRAGETGKTVNIKKGQFLSAESMNFAVEKVRSTGNHKIMVTERGTFFGYQDLVVDMRNIPFIRNIGVPAILDVTHSLQRPNQPEGVSGGNPQMIETLARAGIAAGADGIFLETHPDPSRALSDGANMLELGKLRHLLENLVKLHNTVKKL